MEENIHNRKVINAILANKEASITDVYNLYSIKYMLFNRDEYSHIVELIKSCSWDQIISLSDIIGNGFTEYLEIVKFSDQNQRSIAATFYDNEELWQDPQIIDIFFLTC